MDNHDARNVGYRHFEDYSEPATRSRSGRSARVDEGGRDRLHQADLDEGEVGREHYVVVVATTVPDQVVGLTSCYLGQLDGAIAASHLRLGPGGYERLSAQVLPRAPHVGERARACLLDHAAELQQAIADLTGAQVLVDVAAGALERAVEAWGPAAPDS